MEKRTICCTEIIEAIRSGMGDVPIMEKYQISPGEFMDILMKLKEVEPADSETVVTLLRELQKTCDPMELRSMPRNYLVFAATVHDADDPSVRGSVNDITEGGFQVEGIRAAVNETRKFVIKSEVLAVDTEIAFEATCRWTKPDDLRDHDVAGFEITSISESSLAELRKLIQHLSLGER